MSVLKRRYCRCQHIVRSVLSHDSAKHKIRPVTSADRIGERGLPCGVPNSGSMVPIVWLLKVIDTYYCVMKSRTQAIVRSSIPRWWRTRAVKEGLRWSKKQEISKRSVPPILPELMVVLAL